LEIRIKQGVPYAPCFLFANFLVGKVAEEIVATETAAD
jgi:hypothetical protein